MVSPACTITRCSSISDEIADCVISDLMYKCQLKRSQHSLLTSCRLNAITFFFGNQEGLTTNNEHTVIIEYVFIVLKCLLNPSNGLVVFTNLYR